MKTNATTLASADSGAGERLLAEFEYERIEGLSDRCFVTIDKRYHLAIIRTDEGIIVDVWPIDSGETWDHPYDSFQVFDNDTAVDAETTDAVT
jgi:hypothetical protein